MRPLIQDKSILQGLVDQYANSLEGQISTALDDHTISDNPSWNTLCDRIKDNIENLLKYDLLSLEQLEKRLQFPSLLSTANQPYLQNAKKCRGRREKTIPEKNLCKIFNYDGFSKNEDERVVGARWLCKHLGAIICPYCNREYIASFHIHNKNRLYRPDLDHFMPRKDHPWFALSFFNLIPSCSTCNSRFKLANDFLPSKYMCPITESIDDTLEFSFKMDTMPTNLLLDAGNTSGFDATYEKVNLTIVKRKDKTSSQNDYLRAEKVLVDLDIIARYQSCPEPILILLKKMRDYNPPKMNEIMKICGFDPDNKIAVREWKRTLFGASGHDDDVHKRSLGKITNDLVRQIYKS